MWSTFHSHQKSTCFKWHFSVAFATNSWNIYSRKVALMHGGWLCSRVEIWQDLSKLLQLRIWKLICIAITQWRVSSEIALFHRNPPPNYALRLQLFLGYCSIILIPFMRQVNDSIYMLAWHALSALYKFSRNYINPTRSVVVAQTFYSLTNNGSLSAEMLKMTW